MIRKGILVTSGVLVFAVGLTLAQTKTDSSSDSTFDRLRRATLEHSDGPKRAPVPPSTPADTMIPKAKFHPLEVNPVIQEPATPANEDGADKNEATAVQARTAVQGSDVAATTVQSPIQEPAETAPAETAKTAPRLPDDMKPAAASKKKYVRSNYTEGVGRETVTPASAETTEGNVTTAKSALFVRESRDARPNGPTNIVHAEYTKTGDDKPPIVQVRATNPAASHLTIGSRSVPEKTAQKAVHPEVTVQWVQLSEIVLGEQCEFDLVVKNSGDVTASDLEIDAFFPESVRLVAARPQPSSAEDHLTWKVGELASGESQKLSVKFVPSLRGDLSLNSRVRFTGEAKQNFVVAEPVLHIDIEGPEEVMIGEPASHTITISNPGTGTARDVSLEALIPDGLKHPRGERLRLEVGTLEPGESQEIHLSLAAVDGGTQTLRIASTASNCLRQESSADVLVSAPSLALHMDGPGLRYKGRRGTYTIEVHNDGTADSNNVRLRYRIPAGFEFASATDGGRYDKQSGVIDWFLGRMKSDAKKTVEVELTAVDFGKFTHEAAALSEHGAQAADELVTRVEGTASLSLEIVDLDDPVEVGASNAYEIHVKNEGSIAATNVGVSFELPAGVEFVSAKGPVQHEAEKNAVLFHALPQLAPGKTATYQIQVKATKAGSLRFRARLAADSIKDPLIFEELTKFYGE